jgi:hypothetical protein
VECGVGSGGKFFDLNDLLKPMATIANLGDGNITFKSALPPCKGIAPHLSPLCMVFSCPSERGCD